MAARVSLPRNGTPRQSVGAQYQAGTKPGLAAAEVTPFSWSSSGLSRRRVTRDEGTLHECL